MENIYDGCTQSEKDEIINGLESSFNGQFEKLVERIEGCKTDGEEITLTCSDRNNEGMLQNEQRDKQPGFRKSQANSKIVQRNLELHLSFEAQQKIQDILDEVRQLSEKEKLLLYLKLPTKTGNLTEESQPIPLSNTRQEQTQAFQWIRSSLEECECSYTLPKHEVYDDYKSFCESLGANRTLSAPDFGKIIKCVFPKVKARRLGTRGNSKYCYSGLRKRVSKDSQSHSNVNGQNSDNEVNNNNNNIKNAINDDLTEDQTLSAACNLVCEWANKLLGRVFTTLIDLARFLVGGSYVSTKSMAAFVVMSATESKVRTMSAKLQFHSSSSSSTSPNSKSISSTRTQSPLVAVSSSAPSERLSGKMPTMQAATSSQSKNAFITNGIRLDGTNERPRSLPGLQIAAGDQESIKLSNLMSPPLCPPPKTANQVPKGILPPGGSPIYADTGSHARGIPSTSFLQTNGVGSFPVLIQQSPQQQLARLSNQVQQESPGKRQILSQRTSLKRSDSCPYPSQSPRGRQIAVSQVLSPMSPSQPNDVIRAQNWQGIIGNQQAILVASPDNTMNKIIQEQQQQQQQQQHMLSPIRGTSIIDPMGTPVGRQGQMQRCHSVPAPFNSPQGDIYQPLTPQLRAQVISSTPPNNVASFSQLKETRAKFFKTEIQANARRNLTPSFLSDKEASKVKPFRQIVHERKAESETVSSGASDIPERKAILANDGIPEAIVTASNSKCYGNALRTGSMMGNQSTGSGSVGSRKQSGGLLDESSLTSVDSLMDSTFSLAGVDVSPGCDTVTSGGNGLNDFDGLDDAETIDLLRSLNSGNNIWVNEWNNTGVQLMESS